MKNFLILILIFVLTSCKKKKEFIYYSYDNSTVTRLDIGNNIYLYYGKFENIETLPEKYIKATYSGFDGLMSCYMIFKSDDTIEIVDIEGDFDTVNAGNKMKLVKFNQNIDFINWDTKIKGNYNNILELSDIVTLEVKRNKKNNSKVKAVYPEK